MAEFEINLGDTTVSIDDDGLYDALEYKVDQGIEDWVSNNLDVTDEVYQVIWDFNRWDEIILGQMGYVSVKDLDDGHSVLREEDLDGAIETLLGNFMHVSAEGRCGVGKAFALAVKEVVKEVIPEILAEQERVKAETFTQDFYQVVERISRSNIKLAQQSGLDQLDRIWASGSDFSKFDRTSEEVTTND